MLVESIGVLAVAAVGGPTTRLDIRNTIAARSEHAQEGFRMHRTGADFRVVRLLKNATLLYPKLGERKNQVLKIKPNLFLKFYFRFQIVSNISRANNFRSVCSSI